MTIEGFEGTDVASESSTATESSGQDTQESASNPAQADNQTTAETQLPFHEHPRFKELIEQKNQFAQQSQEASRQIRAMQQQIQQMQQHSQTAKQREDALHARLKGIDPEFGERFAKIDGSLTQLEELRQWKQQMETQQVRERGVNYVNSQHEANKVPSEWRDIYNAQIEAAIRSNPNAQLEDLPNIYKGVHAAMSKLMDSQKRAVTESYVTDKKKDASLPTTPKGKALNTSKQAQTWSKDSSEARSQLVARIRDQLKAERGE